MNDTSSERRGGGACRTKGERRSPVLALHSSAPPSIAPPPSPLWSRVSPLCSPLLSGSGQSLEDPDKRTPPVTGREQRSPLAGGGGGGRRGLGRVSGMGRHCGARARSRPNASPAASFPLKSLFLPFFPPSSSLATFCCLFGSKRSADVSGPAVPVTPLLNDPVSDCFLDLSRFSGAFLWFRPHFRSLWAGKAPFSH